MMEVYWNCVEIYGKPFEFNQINWKPLKKKPESRKPPPRSPHNSQESIPGHFQAFRKVVAGRLL